MLGHTSIKTTQIYAQITSRKVSKEMKSIRPKIDNAYLKSELDVRFDQLSIEEQLSLFNIPKDMLNLELAEDLRQKTRGLWYGLNDEIKKVLINRYLKAS